TVLPRPPLLPYTTLFRSRATASRRAGGLGSSVAEPLDDLVDDGRRRRAADGGLRDGPLDPDVHHAGGVPVEEGGEPVDDQHLARSEEHTSELQSRENLVC